MESKTSSLLESENHEHQDNEKMQFLDEIFRVNEEEEKEEEKKEEETNNQQEYEINTSRPRTRKKLTSSQFLIYLTLFLVILILFRGISLSKIKIFIFICFLISLLSIIKKKKGILLKKIMEQVLYMKIFIDSVKSKLNENNNNNNNRINSNNNIDSETQRLNDNDELEDPLLHI